MRRSGVRRLVHGLTAALGLSFAASLAAAERQGDLPVPSPAMEAPVAMLDSGLLPQSRLVLEPGMDEAPVQRVLQFRKGQSLAALLTGAGVHARDAHDAAAELAKIIDLQRLQIGEKVTIMLAGGRHAVAVGALSGLHIKREDHSEVGVGRLVDGRFQFFKREPRLTRDQISIRGEITSSLHADGVRLGAPAAVMLKVFRLFSYSLDLQRDIHPGDRFELVFDSYSGTDGLVVDHGDIHYAALRTGDRDMQFYRFEAVPGRFDYFDAEGKGVRRALLTTPVDSVRITSGFGNRRHPILGYNKMHRGVDFGAPTGSLIRAAGDGTVVAKGRKGAYGHYIRIRHKAGYQTAYAHLSRYARGLKKGKKVKQGEVIGYVGSTGRSTGPHLHYEVLVNGKQVNPLKLKLPSSENLEGEALARFQTRREEIDRMLQELTVAMLVDTGPVAVP